MGVVTKLFRYSSAAAISLSTLGAGVAGWAWWHAGHVRHDRVELFGMNGFASVTSGRSGVDLLLIREWPWPAVGRVHAYSVEGNATDEGFKFRYVGHYGLFRVPLGPEVLSASHQVLLKDPVNLEAVEKIEPSNPPTRLVSTPLPPPDEQQAHEDVIQQEALRWSAPLATTSVPQIPHVLLVTFLLLPAVGWLLLQTIRLAWRRGIAAGALRSRDGVR